MKKVHSTRVAHLRRCTLFIALFPFYAAWSADIERVPRPMRIHRVAELGLEIWTEKDPLWETALSGRSVFTAETPALTYPPAGMTWVSLPHTHFSPEELEAGARGALQQVARNYQVRDVSRLVLTPARYGELSGYESRFSGSAHGARVEVLVFVGHKPGRPAVLAQAYTLEGKLDHIREHVRRSWSNLRYLR
jgi:hypothetical protein